MSRRTCYGLVLLLLVAPGALADESAANRLSHALVDARFVELYFVSKTGGYDYSPVEIRRVASVRLRRECGRDCANLMAPVVSHLRNARGGGCQRGQQDVLIDLGDDAHILYSYSGRTIEYQGRCYFNPEGVRGILRSIEFY